MKELDWANLPFGYMKTDYNVRIYNRNGQWGELEVDVYKRQVHKAFYPKHLPV